MRHFNRSRPPKKLALALFAALALIALAALPPYLRAKKSEQWPTTNGLISKNWVEVVYSSKSRRYSYFPRIEYRYHVGSKEYRSGRFAFGRDRYFSQLRDAQSILDAHPMRSEVKVDYDPTDPSFAILQPGLDNEMELLYKMELWFIGIFTFAFLATALWYDDGRKAAGPPNLPSESRPDSIQIEPHFR